MEFPGSFFPLEPERPFIITGLPGSFFSRPVMTFCLNFGQKTNFSAWAAPSSDARAKAGRGIADAPQQGYILAYFWHLVKARAAGALPHSQRKNGAPSSDLV